jgi:hypothetical protein
MPSRPARYPSSLLPPPIIHNTHSQSFQSNGISISQSTASLPPKYHITLALPLHTELTEEERCQRYKEGEEYLADAWRRAGDSAKEGKIQDRKRKRVVAFEGDVDPRPEEGVELVRGGVLWYTAGLQFACSCECEPLIDLSSGLQVTGRECRRNSVENITLLKGLFWLRGSYAGEILPRGNPSRFRWTIQLNRLLLWA